MTGAHPTTKSAERRQAHGPRCTMDSDEDFRLTQMAVDLLSAYLANNTVQCEALPDLIRNTRAALADPLGGKFSPIDDMGDGHSSEKSGSGRKRSPRAAAKAASKCPPRSPNSSAAHSPHQELDATALPKVAAQPAGAPDNRLKRTLPKSSDRDLARASPSQSWLIRRKV